ncbi:MAG: tyrosine-type recombinase/integrase [Oscillospiraceae bacterium]|nr:tyrosine-type recombinase/integrase [Oscillospiraceae bacterium]
MKCRKCGAEIPDGSIYCNMCGVKQTTSKQKVKSRGNGTGSVYQLPGGGWKAVAILRYYRDESGKLKKHTASKKVKTKKEAVNALPSLLSRSTPIEHKHITLTELEHKFENTKKYDALSKSQKSKLKYAWNRLSPIQTRDICTLSVEEMQDIIDSATKTYYPARDMKVLLSHLYDTAKRFEYITYNKTENIELPELKKTKKQIFTENDIFKFWCDFYGRTENGKPAQQNIFTGYILIMIFAGLRYGEVSTILLENIHLQDRYMVGGIKSEAGIDRVIPINRKLVPVLKMLMPNQKKKLLEMNEDNFYSTYWETVDRLQVSHLTPHSCRHTYFTMMADKQVPPALIAEAGGHADFDTTYRNYVHTPIQKLVEAVDKI